MDREALARAGLNRRDLARAGLAFALWPAAAWALPTLQRHSGTLMGTRLSLSVLDGDARRRERALQAAWDRMAWLSAMMSRYEPGGWLQRLADAAGSGDALRVPPELAAVLEQALQRARQTGGLFDPTVGAYADWRFAPDAQPPAPARLAQQARAVDHRAVQVDGAHQRVSLQRPGMKLDLGGVAKLPILAAGMEVLRQHGVHHALIDGGGDVLCMGQMDGRDWRVGLRDPRAPERLLGVLELGGEAIVASSGDYERFFDRDGHRYHHILDPRSGQPSQGLQGLSLVAREVSQVNAWGAAMMVAGAVQARRWAAHMPGVALMLAGHGEGLGRDGLWLSEGLQARLRQA